MTATLLPIVVSVMSEDEVAMFGRTLEAGSAGFGSLETARGLLPLTALDVDVRVAGIVASIEVAQTFVNTTGIAIEATYMFPLPDRAAVHRCDRDSRCPPRGRRRARSRPARRRSRYRRVAVRRCGGVRRRSVS